MARKSNWPPKVYFHRGTGQDRIRVNGRDIYLGPHGSPEARAEYARVVVTLAAGGVPPAKSSAPEETVSDVVSAWWAHAQGTYDPRGRELEQFQLSLAPLLRLYGPEPASTFDARALEVVRQAMAAGTWYTPEELAQRGERYPAAWSRNVVNRRIVRIRTVWRWADSHGLVPHGNWGNLRTLKALAPNSRLARHTAPVEAATWHELRLVLRRVEPVPQAMLLLQWWAGMRSGEVRLMRPCEIDRTGPVWIYRPSEHKNAWRGQERAIPLGPKCQAVLGRFVRHAADTAYLFPPGRGARTDHYTPFTYAQVVRRAAEAAGVPGFHPYRLRHAARLRITRERGLDAARAILGHKSLGTTNEYAAGVDLQTAVDAARHLS
jgi:integrase